MALPQYQRPGTQWYVSDGYIWDDHHVSLRRESGGPRECSSKLFIYNPQSKPARARVRIFTIDRGPSSFEVQVGPGKVEEVELAAREEVPHRQSFWIAIESDLPVLPQARHEDYTFWDPVPDAMVAVTPYPGPLKDETSWIFPDCFQGGARSWHERETLSILNPGKEKVSVKVRYLIRNRDLGGEEEITIPAERVAMLEVWERGPKLLGSENGPAVRVEGDYAVRIDASGPVIAQTTRRARWRGFAPVIGSRSTIGFPLRGESYDLWYYPGGNIVDRGILPRAKESEHPLGQCDNMWNLLFVNNLEEAKTAKVRATFHKVDGSSSVSDPLPIKPLKSILECLHGKPWLGAHTKTSEPFAITVASDGPVAAEVCCAEFEMWSQVCPGAMTAVNLYPGPLTDERTWWLGIGHAGGADDVNLEWEQTYCLFNPGAKAARVTLRFLGLAGGEVTHALTLGPGAVAHVRSSEIGGLPMGEAFAVRAEGDQPFCAQVIGRSFTRGLAHTRGIYSFMGVPMGLEA